MTHDPRTALITTMRSLRKQPQGVLERSNTGDFWITAAGQAISAPRAHLALTLRNLQYGLYYGFWALFAVAVGVMGGGVVGGLVGAAIAALTVASVDRSGRLRRRYLKLLRHGRRDEAEAMCRRVLARRRASEQLRAVAHRGLAYLQLLDGSFAEALERYRIAIDLCEKSPESFGRYDRATLRYGEVLALVNLGRTDEARASLSGVPAPAGDYLRIQHWTAELIVQFGAGRVSLSEEELWERARVGLAVLASGLLVPLCAWAFARLGDDEMSRHLREVAFDRGVDGLERVFPALHRWLQSPVSSDPETRERRAVSGAP